MLLERIENRHGGGVPDIYGVWKGLPFWIELKGKVIFRANLSPHQIAWHTRHSHRKGLSFFLLSTAVRGSSALISGIYATDLGTKPVSEVQGPRFEDHGAMWEGLCGAVEQHYRGLLGTLDGV
jgi:hypothetical protein